MIRDSIDFHTGFRGFLFGLATAAGFADMAWAAIPLVAALFWSYWREDKLKQG